MKRVVLVFLKYPAPGKVKTRLAADLGDEEAAIAYRKMVCRVFEQCRSACPDEIAIAYDPPEKEAAIQGWLSPWLEAFPGEIRWIPQVPGDLGERLEAAVSEAFQSNPDAGVTVIGTDCVHLDTDIFETAWNYLKSGIGAVFGPSEDGGYYLLAMKKLQPALFRDIPWSTGNTLEASLEAAGKARLEAAILETRIDIDTLDEWRRVESELSSRKCVFFDRDGVVNRSPGSGYVLNRDEFVLNPGIPEALAWLKDRGWLTIVATSQRGVGKGLMSRKDLDEIHCKMQRELGSAAFDGICAYTGEAGCAFQPKPDPRMLFSAAESFFIDLRRSFLVGDADRDIEMGKAAGLSGTIRIQTDKPIGIEADWTLQSSDGILGLFREIL